MQGLQDDPLEPVELRGMLYHDGVDSLGRPVIVLNADAVAANVSRQWACLQTALMLREGFLNLSDL